VTLAPGQVYRATGDQVGALCFNGGPTGGEYALIPFFASEVASARLNFSVTANGVSQLSTPFVSHAASHSHGRMGSAADLEDMHIAHQWEMQFRENAERELSRLLPGGGGARLSTASSDLRPAQASTSNDPRLRISIVRTR
jgi:hypothetical protein